MRIPYRDYEMKSFYSMLTSHSEDFSGMKVIYLNSRFKVWTHADRLLALEQLFLRHAFQLKRMGSLMELETRYRDPVTDAVVPVRYYAILSPQDGVIRCFTVASATQIDRTLGPVTGESGLYYLWISPSVFEQLKNEIFNGFPHTTITFFSATKKSPIGPKGKIRPDIGRTIIYHGEDGKETLEEYEYYYGVVPRTIRFHIPGTVDMQIGARGILTYMRGDLDFMLNFGEKTVKLALEIRRILETSKRDTVSIRTAKKELRVPYVVPWIVDFSQPLDASGCNALIRDLSRNQFTVYNHIIIEGSLRFDATVVDEAKKTIFEVSASKDKMLVSPRYEAEFDTFLRFLETIVENFDPSATCRIVEGGGDVTHKES